MKKRIIFFIMFFLLVITVSFGVIANGDTNDAVGDDNVGETDIEKAFIKLESEVAGKCSDLIFKKQVFSLLALGYDGEIQDECKSALLDESSKDECWPKSDCNVKETALALYALSYNAFNTEQITNWITDEAKSTTSLSWYLIIDPLSDNTAECTITYKDKDYDIKITPEDEIDSGAGTCLSLSSDKYWLEIKNSDSCLENKYEISCDEDFVTSLFYKRENSNVNYLPSLSHPESADGATEEQVNSKCFEKGNSCDYESTAWAALALQQARQPVSSYIPYLMAFADENENLMPDAFLYILTKRASESGDYFSNLITSQTSGHWEAVSSPYNKYYDSSLALLALQDSNSIAVDDAKDYFLEDQDKNNWWGSIENTGFLLHATWPKQPITPREPCPGGSEYCGSEYACTGIGGISMETYYCPSIGDICCSEKLLTKNCSDYVGIICPSGKICKGGREEPNVIGLGIGETCCVGGECADPEIPRTNACEDAGGACKFSCEDDEKESKVPAHESACSPNLCCVEKGGGFPFWIIILFILIILVVLAILFRKKLKNLFSKKRKSPKDMPGRPPGMPQRIMLPRPRPRMLPRARSPPLRMPRKSSSQLGMSETLKKLKEMSK